MTTGQLIFLAAGTAIFVYWAVQMFRTLFLIRRRCVDETGSSNPGPIATLAGWRSFLRSPEDAAQRTRLGLSMLALFIWIAISALSAP